MSLQSRFQLWDSSSTPVPLVFPPAAASRGPKRSAAPSCRVRRSTCKRRLAHDASTSHAYTATYTTSAMLRPNDLKKTVRRCIKLCFNEQIITLLLNLQTYSESYTLSMKSQRTPRSRGVDRNDLPSVLGTVGFNECGPKAHATPKTENKTSKMQIKFECFENANKI
jgi:hypothetical protein